jgi:flagellar basal-body rod protein FlgB
MNTIGSTSIILDLITAKQKALGSNLANVDTPGYVRKDVDFGQYLNTMNSPLETKLSSALGPSGIIEDKSYEQINPANELMELQKNSLLYSMATRRMSNIITQMKTVINVGK